MTGAQLGDQPEHDEATAAMVQAQWDLVEASGIDKVHPDGVNPDGRPTPPSKPDA